MRPGPGCGLAEVTDDPFSRSWRNGTGSLSTYRNNRAGAVGVFGLGTEALWSRLDAGDAGFAPCTRYSGDLPCAEAVKPDLRRLLQSGRLSRASLVSQFAIAAVHLALEQAGLLAGKGAADRAIGIVYGTSNGPGATTRRSTTT